jgi:hypothetical protein
MIYKTARNRVKILYGGRSESPVRLRDGSTEKSDKM